MFLRFALILATASLLLAPGSSRAADEINEGAEPRYPAAFRTAVHEAIQRGMASLRDAQRADGTFDSMRAGGPHAQALGRTALPLLALLKGGMAPGDPTIVRGMRAMHGFDVEATYSAACFLMAIHAFYRPALDMNEEEIGEQRSKRVEAEEVAARLSPRDRKALERGRDFLVAAQDVGGLWSYGVGTRPSGAYDLSNTQYALLGLRAAADCGIAVPLEVWRNALDALVGLQDEAGEEMSLVGREVRGGYVFRTDRKAAARGFPYQRGPLDARGPRPPIEAPDATGSMTTAGVACVAICVEGLWRHRRFSGASRAKAERSLRDGQAWMQKHFSVTENPNNPNWHLYYLYGLERMGMLLGIRWLGEHDWYKEGADVLLGLEDKPQGGWGNTIDTSFAILFLKRSTMPLPVLTVR